MHAFDVLLTEPGEFEEVQPHTATMIKRASDNLLGSGQWEVLHLLRKYESHGGLGVTYTRDNGRNISKAFQGHGGHVGTAHACQTTFK